MFNQTHQEVVSGSNSDSLIYSALDLNTIPYLLLSQDRSFSPSICHSFAAHSIFENIAI